MPIFKSDSKMADENEEHLNPHFRIQTSKGQITLELFPEAAPKTVDNFLRLINDKFYDGLTFHRHVPNFVIQGGCPKGDGTGGPGWKIPGEFKQRRLRKKMPKHELGVLAMARSGNPHSAGSQFYICLDSAPHLDGQYTSFGRVIEGIEVVNELRNGDKIEHVSLLSVAESSIITMENK